MSPTRQENRRRNLRRWAPRGAALAVLGLAATGCASNDLTRLGMPEPITNQAERVLSLWQGSWVAAFAVGILVWGLIVWSVIFHRKRSEQLPPQVRYNMPIEALYTVLPIVIISVLFFFTARDQAILLDTDEPADVNIEVVAFQWAWQFNYLDDKKENGGEVLFSETGIPNPDGTADPSTQTTLVLPEGATVHFDLHSPDVIHSFWIPEFGFKMDVIPGRDNAFQADINEGTAGEYVGRCAELCGVDHARMLFNVQVLPQDEYDAWAAEQQQAAEEAELEAADTGDTPDSGEGSGAEGAGAEGAGTDEEGTGSGGSEAEGSGTDEQDTGSGASDAEENEQS
ncbi:aa3-type cytochrome oxidase subunit II [Nocardiopsis dassonvillei]|uniref:cytochrome-c oxidase n=2 Tax=Nocardiopsidaceae TaxID=83676 RepID=D7B2A2_NOCDD|nr:cytochrome c oxidase, subunit II [Nocardiopsis dassonvillei subsp. dassonvillei DSM 43111]VEI89066.1 Cytochrome c oxidase subunit 2 precursor [Nocardiopsis dassonvillei]